MIIGLLVAIGVFGLTSLIIYNALIAKKNQVENSFAGIDVQLKKRYDLIPNLIATVKEYAKHEKEILGQITALRSQAMDPNVGKDQEVKINNELTGLLGGLKVQMEAYPDLKANSNFLDLQSSLNEIEAQLSAARRTFNAAVTDYNNGVQMFPSSIFAAMMGLKTKTLFEAAPEERKNHNVKDLFAA
ncbi:LemA family protein [bacterium]|nr:LemA family protein [bacterium]